MTWDKSALEAQSIEYRLDPTIEPTNSRISIREQGSITTSVQVHQGLKDVQGIYWNRTTIQSRERYRVFRSRPVQNNQFTVNDRYFGKATPTAKTGEYYNFSYSTKAFIKPSIPHFQIRSSVWCTSPEVVFFFGSLTPRNEFVELARPRLSTGITEMLQVGGSNMEPPEMGVLPQDPHVTTLTIKGKLCIAGGFNGEIICKMLGEDDGVGYGKKPTFCSQIGAANNVVNCIDVYGCSSSPLFLVCSNDGHLREYDSNGFKLIRTNSLGFPINHASVSPDGSCIVAIGDTVDGCLLDPHDWRKHIADFRCHDTTALTCAWHPDSFYFATGGEDQTCTSFLCTLMMNWAPACSVRFTGNGRYLAVAESSDFVHLYDVCSDYQVEQQIDLFGSVAGISLCPEDDTLWIGISDSVFSSLLEYKQQESLDIASGSLYLPD